nr:transporter substrate-binding domain-containing protein [Rhodospirillum rubrum]
MLGLACLPATAAPDPPAPTRRLVVSSSYWPPYTGPELPGGGKVVAPIAAALREIGVALKVIYVPWPRALSLFAEGEVDGFLPTYDRHGQSCQLSEPVLDTVLGFVEPVDAPVHWAWLSDLAGLRIGLVVGYSNAPEFDRLVASGVLTTEVVTSDLRNVLKVAAGRLDLAVIDREVFDHLIAHEPEARAVAHEVRFSRRLLAIRPVFLCLRASEPMAEVLTQINRALRLQALGKP